MKRLISLSLLYSLALFVLSGCAATQQVTQFSETQPKMVCIAKHEAVKEGVLSALEKGLTKHGVNSQIMNAQYVEKHKMWTPSINPNYAKNCDAIMFYVANWAWDVTMYMYYANIWVTDPDMTRKLAQASYTAGAGFSKFINAETKILEMIDSIFTEYYSKQNTQITQSVKTESKMAQPSFNAPPLALTVENPDTRNPVTPSYINEPKALAASRDEVSAHRDNCIAPIAPESVTGSPTRKQLMAAKQDIETFQTKSINYRDCLKTSAKLSALTDDQQHAIVDLHNKSVELEEISASRYNDSLEQYKAAQIEKEHRAEQAQNKYEEPDKFSYINELKALAVLRDEDIITEEEFQKQKTKILEKE